MACKHVRREDEQILMMDKLAAGNMLLRGPVIKDLLTFLRLNPRFQPVINVNTTKGNLFNDFFLNFHIIGANFCVFQAMNFVASSKQDIEQEQRRKQDQIRTIKYDVRRMIEDQMKKRFSPFKNFLQLFDLSPLFLIAV